MAIRKISAEEVQRALADPRTHIYYSRCLVCGRRTPHEVCHGHADHNNWPSDLDAAWQGDALEAEDCSDSDCPQWDTEAEREQARRRAAARE